MAGLLLDTGPVWAILDRVDQYHKRSSVFLRQELKTGAQLLLPRIAYAEVLGHATSALERWTEKEHRLDHAQRIMSEIDRLGLRMVDHTPEDFNSAAGWWQRYADRPIDYPDALIAATAYRTGVTRIWTYDEVMIRLLEKVAPKISCLRPRIPR